LKNAHHKTRKVATGADNPHARVCGSIVEDLSILDFDSRIPCPGILNQSYLQLHLVCQSFHRLLKYYVRVHGRLIRDRLLDLQLIKFTNMLETISTINILDANVLLVWRSRTYSIHVGTYGVILDSSVSSVRLEIVNARFRIPDGHFRWSDQYIITKRCTHTRYFHITFSIHFPLDLVALGPTKLPIE